MGEQPFLDRSGKCLHQMGLEDSVPPSPHPVVSQLIAGTLQTSLALQFLKPLFRQRQEQCQSDPLLRRLRQ